MSKKDAITIPFADNNVPFIVNLDNYLDSLSLPAIDFECGGKTLTFILDSGSNGSHINKSVIEDLGLESYTLEPEGGKVQAVSTGNGLAVATNERCEMALTLNGFEFSVRCSVEKLDQVFNFIRESDGVQLHGILGTDFLRLNRWTIDFANNVAYPAFKVKR